MTRRTIGLISIILAVVVGMGALMTVPAVYAETKTVAPRQSVTAKRPVIAKRTLTPADKANLLTLKALYKQIGDTAKLIRDKVKADKAAGKDLTTFTADLKTALKDATHRAVSRGIMLTEAERTALAAMQTSIRTFEQQLKTQRKAKALQTILDATKVQIKAAIAARTAYLKTIHTAALTDYSNRLVTLIADANVKLASLQALLNALPTLP
jgi:arsenate reductase-like glutaredoxin family protein